MPYNFLYIDDERKDKVDGTITGLNQIDYITIKFINPDPSWDDQIDYIVRTQKEISGIILDLRLQEETNLEKGGKARYRGSSLAQELRTLSKEGSLKDLPIILLSATEQIDKSFDSTGKDLFDLTLVKDQVKELDYPIIRQRLFGLAKAYEDSREIVDENVPEGLKKVLGTVEDITVDFRLIASLSNYIIEKKPFHQISNFYLKSVVCKPGVLINEAYLAARLGIDKDISEDWGDLKKHLEHFSYTGFFKEGWQRWWALGLSKWWKEKISEKVDLPNLSASDRVSLLKDKLGLSNLHPKNKLPRCSSSDFWVICKGTGMPIAIVDGFGTSSGLNTYPWQDQEYVSIDAALDRTNLANWKNLSPFENERLEKLKKFFTRERKR